MPPFFCKWRYLYTSIHTYIKMYRFDCVFVFSYVWGSGFLGLHAWGVWSLGLGVWGLSVLGGESPCRNLRSKKQHRDFIGAILGLY